MRIVSYAIDGEIETFVIERRRWYAPCLWKRELWRSSGCDCRDGDCLWSHTMYVRSSDGAWNCSISIHLHMAALVERKIWKELNPRAGYRDSALRRVK